MAAFVATLSPNTARAYRSDLSHLYEWLAGTQSGNVLSGRSLGRYLRSLVAGGSSESVIRRRISCLRSFLGFAGLDDQIGFDAVVREFRDRRDRLSGQGRLSMVAVSSDVIVRHGIEQVADTTGFVDVAVFSPEDFAAAAVGLPRFDWLMVHLRPTSGLDRLSDARSLSISRRLGLASAAVVVPTFSPSQLVSLRLAEAGCQYVVPYPWLAENTHEAFAGLAEGTVDERRALATQWALREELGLRWDGALQPLLDAAVELPARVWTTSAPMSSLGLPRAVFRNVQELARDVAGVPEPHFSRYASSLRRAPELPEWPRVRALVRDCWLQHGL